MSRLPCAQSSRRPRRFSASSKTARPAGSSFRLTGVARGFPELQGFFNGDINLNADRVDESEGRYKLGADIRLLQEGSVGIAFLARHPFERIGKPGFLDVPRANGAPSPLFGLQLDRPNFYDLSIGGRVALWRDTLVAFANVIVPLNADGLRASAIPLAGLEATF